MIKGKFRAWLAWYLITLSFAYIFVVTLSETAQASKSSDTILGFLLGTGLSAVIAFYFGSNESPNNEEVTDDNKETGL